MPEPVFKPEEWDIHGFHDDRHVLVVTMAATIAAGLIQKYGADKEGRQTIADAALDITLKILNRVATKPDPKTGATR